MILIIVMQVGIILLKRLKKIFMKMFALSKIFRGLRWKLEWTIAYKTKGRDPLNPFLHIIPFTEGLVENK